MKQTVENLSCNSAGGNKRMQWLFEHFLHGCSTNTHDFRCKQWVVLLAKGENRVILFKDSVQCIDFSSLGNPKKKEVFIMICRKDIKQMTVYYVSGTLGDSNGPWQLWSITKMVSESCVWFCGAFTKISFLAWHIRWLRSSFSVSVQKHHVTEDRWCKVWTRL